MKKMADEKIGEDDNETNIRRGLDVIQSMIDISAGRLEGLRTQCATSAELTQQEIRTLETKLVKMFSELLITKAKLPERLPRGIPPTGAELKQWLRVVGLSLESLDIVLQRVNTLETLLEKGEQEIRDILCCNANIRDEEVNRLARAMINLKRCRECLNSGQKEPNDLFWDSWDRHHHVHHRTGASPRTYRSGIRYQHPQQNRLNPDTNTTNIGSPNNDSDILENHKLQSGGNGGIISPEETSTSTVTPSPSPPNSPSTLGMTNRSRNRGGGFPTTPPPEKKYFINNNKVIIDSLTLPKSKSDESQFISNLTQENNLNNQLQSSLNSNIITNNHQQTTIITRNRLHTEPGFDSHHNDLNEKSSNNLTVPRSPGTPNITNLPHTIGHNNIAHKFTKKFKVMSTCNLCNKQMFFGLKCKGCKYLCHKDCESNVPNTCRANLKYNDEYKNSNLTSNSPNLNRNRSQGQNIIYHGHDSSSAGSSCNSSSPSSPAPLLLPIPPQPIIQSKYTLFDFPDIHQQSQQGNITLETHPIVSESSPVPTSPRPPLSVTQNKHQSNDSDKTVSTGSTSASTDSDRTPVRLDSTEERDSVSWPRQNSLSLKEWDIPYDDLHLLEKIGKGRFGTVHRALWHGDVAVKILTPDYLDDERRLEAFKLEVATFKKTRHENVVLFMGACMKPPRLAIVTSLCKGNTLYTHIHLRKDKFNLNRTTLVAQQISQGMGYLHARGIVHKDLKTKNIFLENGKVIITDFGLFSATKLSYGKFGLGIPQGWLCYLAPELICRLLPYKPTDEDLPFSKSSDVYAFGTVWYELLCGEFPFKSQSPEAIIWQVGRGMKQTLANIQASRDVKDILMLCWSFQADDRPDFTKLLTLLERLPKKRLARSPSHPVQLSRSAESVF